MSVQRGRLWRCGNFATLRRSWPVRSLKRTTTQHRVEELHEPMRSICVAESRVSCEPAVKLLLLSLTTHSPGVEVNLYYAPASREFLDWLRHCPQVRLQTSPLANATGWNVKPVAIMDLL